MKHVRKDATKQEGPGISKERAFQKKGREHKKTLFAYFIVCRRIRVVLLTVAPLSRTLIFKATLDFCWVRPGIRLYLKDPKSPWSIYSESGQSPVPYDFKWEGEGAEGSF